MTVILDFGLPYMKILNLFSTLFFILVLYYLPSRCDAQIKDTLLIKKLSINGVCLCNTTLSTLRQANVDLKEVKVKEFDLANDCFGQDSRFIAGEGFTSNKYPGLIFQKDQNTGQISKIQLTKDFAGKLPDGKFIKMEGLLLKDLFKLYPQLKNTWGSRGCSDYWNFSNDTLSFYVKIDKSKQPQFPIDEKYYENKSVEAAELAISCYSFQPDLPKIKFNDHPNDPVFFLDSVRVNRGVLENYSPSEFVSITVYKDSNAVKRIGPDGKNGLVYLETKEFARRKYWAYFKSKSSEYGKVVSSPENDVEVQYVLNNEVLKESFEADLESINDRNFKAIKVISQPELLKVYGIKNKKYGIIISADINPHKKTVP